jgi:hypothetical protein
VPTFDRAHERSRRVSSFSRRVHSFSPLVLLFDAPTTQRHRFLDDATEQRAQIIFISVHIFVAFVHLDAERDPALLHRRRPRLG